MKYQTLFAQYQLFGGEKNQYSVENDKSKHGN